MSKEIRIIAEFVVDPDKVKEASTIDDLASAIRNEMNWVNESGICLAQFWFKKDYEKQTRVSL